MIVCTVTCSNNLHRAKVMARSVKQFHPEARTVVCLLEEGLHPAACYEGFDEVVLARDLGIDRFYPFLFKYNVYEGSCAMKPFILEYAMTKYGDGHHFLYLDTDMRLYHRLDEIEERLDRHAVILTPHQLEMLGNTPSYLFYGPYNAGAVAVARSSRAKAFLDWWKERLYRYCYFDSRFFLDQRWLNLAPVLFDAHILKHPGYNMAAWNVAEAGRRIVSWTDGIRLRDGHPLCLFHFTCLDGFLQTAIQYTYPDPDEVLRRLLDPYLAELEEMGKSELAAVPWSYNFFRNGKPISEEDRLRFRQLAAGGSGEMNPYLSP